MPAPEAKETPSAPTNSAWSVLVAMPDDRPPRWIVMIVSNPDITARYAAESQFTAERVLDIRPGTTA